MSAIFKSVISVNPDWQDTDIIMACPDYPEYGNITYNNGIITFG